MQLWVETVYLAYMLQSQQITEVSQGKNSSEA